MKYKAVIFLLASALVAALIVIWRDRQPSEPSSGPAPPSELAELLVQARQHPGLAAAHIGLCVLDADGGVVFEDTARTALIPASSLKTVTTATALEKWGPDLRLETQLRAVSPMVGGVVQGDLILTGGADPMLSLEDLKDWAAELKTQGLQRITGRIVGDGRLLAGSIYDDFWDWGDIGNGYGSGVAGLNLAHNRYTAAFGAGPEVGAPAVFLGAQPEVPGVKWNSEVTTAAAHSGDGVMIHGGERTALIHLRGTVPLGAQHFTVTGAVPDPERFAAHHFREALVAVGVQVDGAAVSISSIEPSQRPEVGSGSVIGTHRSPPLIEIITSIHDTSDNHETECLFRLLGIRGGKAADAVIREHWQGRGLTFEGLRMEDGCGLARADFIRPLDLARLQHFAAQGQQGEVYKRSLLSTEDGKVRWKGGAMSNVRSTTGYVVAASGVEYSFAFMANHYAEGSAVAELRDAILSAISRL